MTTYSQRYASGDSNTAGAFVFHTNLAGSDIAFTKLGYGADGADPTTVTASAGLPVAQQGTWTIQPGNTANTTAWLVTGTGGTFPVTDSGGSLTVDAPVATPVFVRLSDGAAAITTLPVSLASVPSHDVTNAGTFAVQATIAAGATAIAKSEDSASADADVGVPSMAVRKASPANTSSTDGDYEMLQMSAGRLWTSATIDAALPAGTNAIGKLAANAGVTIGAVEIAAAQTLATITTLGTITNVVHVDDNAGSLTVDGTVTASIAAGATTIAKAEDAASADADVGVPSMAVRKATPANTSGTDGDYEMLQMSAGRLWTSATIDTALPAGTNAIGKLASNTGVTIGAVEIAAAQTLATVTTVSTVTTCSTVTTLTGGGVAHDGADSGNPIKVGAKASATLSDDTMVANADRTDLTSDLDGAIYVRHVPLGDIITERISNTDGSSTAFTNFGATASTRSYITAISAFNSSATAGYIDFRDGTAGSVLYTVPIPAGGGVVMGNGSTALFYTTANTALAYDVSAALTTVYLSVTGFKSKARA